jgi:virulence-associated protein VagC
VGTIDMTTARLIQNGEHQAVELPTGFEFSGTEVAIRKAGDAVILEPIKASRWPDGFFESIRINDPAFQRPPQGKKLLATALAFLELGIENREMTLARTVVPRVSSG